MPTVDVEGVGTVTLDNMDEKSMTLAIKEIQKQHSKMLEDDKPSQVGEFFGQLYNDAKDILPGIGRSVMNVGAMANPMRNPQGAVDAANELAGPNVDQARKAHQSFKQGDYSEAFGHGLASALPGVGPIAAQSGEEIGRGEYGKGVAHAAEAILPEAMPRAQIVKGAKKVGSAIEDLRRVDPVIAAEKAWSPTPSQDTFHEQLPETLSIIKKAHGGEIKTNKEAIVGANKALKEHKDTFSKWMARAKANRAYVSGDAIVKATWDAIPETLKRENPKRAQAIIKEAQRAYGGKRLSVDMADQFRQEKTADLKSFYGKSTGGQISAVSGTSPEVVLKAQRDALANELYNALDPQGKGAGPRAIRTQQAHIIDVLDAARRRETMATASKPVSKAAAVAGAAPKLVQSVVGGPGMGYIKAADIVNPETLWAGSVDPWVRKAFKAVGEPTRTSLPQPGPWVTPVPRNLLPPPRGRTVTPSAGQPLVTPAPPGSTPQSGPLPRQYPPGSGNNRLLAPPSQVQQPGFAVQDMVPVTDPHTGRLTYVPQHWEEGQIPATSTADPYPPKAIPEAPQTPPAISNSTRATDPQGRKLTPRQRLALARLRRKRQAQA